MVLTHNFTSLTHPLEQYDDLLKKFEGYIVPLGLTLGFAYEHVSRDTGFNGASIQVNKRYESDQSTIDKSVPLISILGNFHEPLTRYKFAAIATSIMIHQKLTQDTRFDHMADIEEIDHDLLGPIMWWANNISKTDIIGRSNYTKGEYGKFKIKLAASDNPSQVLPQLLTDFPNEDWIQDLNDPSNIGVPYSFKGKYPQSVIKMTSECYNPRIWKQIFQKQLYLACGVSGLDVITLPMQHKAVGFLHRDQETSRLRLVHGGQVSFAKAYSIGLVGLGLYVMSLSGKFNDVNFDHVDILHTFSEEEELGNNRELSYKHLILGHAIFWAMQFTGNSMFRDFLPRSLTAIWLRYHRNHNHLEWWED